MLIFLLSVFALDVAIDQLKAFGIELSPSGHFRTASGRILTLEEMIALGYLDGLTEEELQALRCKLADMTKDAASESRINPFYCLRHSIHSM